MNRSVPLPISSRAFHPGLRRFLTLRHLAMTVALGGLVPLWAMPNAAWAVGEQNARLRGTIVEAGTDVPMQGAVVIIRGDALIGGPKRAVADDEGRFDFPLLPPGKYTITVEYEGLKPTQRRVSLDLGQTQNIKIPLSAELAHAGVIKTAVVGRPDPEWGEVVIAFVVRAPGANVTAADLDAHCLEYIARFKRPKEYRFLDELPTSSYGKVLKNELRKML